MLITLRTDTGEVKARLRDDERTEEEYFLSLARTLPVATAAGKLNVHFNNG